MAEPTDGHAAALAGLSRSATAARLCGSVVHDANNALQVIASTVEMLQLQPDLSPRVATALERLEQQTSRAAVALASLLPFTRPLAGDTERVSLHEVAVRAAGLRRYAVERAGHPLIVVAAPDVSYAVRARRGALEQVIVDLILQMEEWLAETGADRQASGGATEAAAGREAAASDRPEGLVLALDGGAGLVTLRLSLSGRRAAPGEMERCFEPFHAGERGGAGLWAARRIAESLEGTLVADADGADVALVLALPHA
ncbi:MAG: hypothetical protein AB7G23_04930 [Vicinamibacterales bacterium]